MNITLPFERGSTYFEGDTDRATSTGTDHLLGQTFRVRDNKDAVNNGLETEKVLVVVRNGSSGNLTQGYGVKFDTSTAKTLLRIAKGRVVAQGDFGLAIDDAYGNGFTIVPNDLFYAVLSGPNKSLPAADTASARMASGAFLTWDAGGRLEVAAANDANIGRGDAFNTNTNTTSPVLVHHQYPTNF